MPNRKSMEQYHKNIFVFLKNILLNLILVGENSYFSKGDTRQQYLRTVELRATYTAIPTRCFQENVLIIWMFCNKISNLIMLQPNERFRRSAGLLWCRSVRSDILTRTLHIVCDVNSEQAWNTRSDFQKHVAGIKFKIYTGIYYWSKSISIGNFKTVFN